MSAITTSRAPWCRNMPGRPSWEGVEGRRSTLLVELNRLRQLWNLDGLLLPPRNALREPRQAEQADHQ